MHRAALWSHPGQHTRSDAWPKLPLDGRRRMSSEGEIVRAVQHPGRSVFCELEGDQTEASHIDGAKKFGGGTFFGGEFLKINADGLPN